MGFLIQIPKWFDHEFTTACLSLTYFDRFLSMRPIGQQSSRINCRTFGAQRSEGCLTENELILLEAFEGDLNLVTPFTYLHYFIHKFCAEWKPEESLPRAAELIMDPAGEINIMDHRLSVITAATILAGIYDQLTVEDLELKMSTIPFSGSLEM
ncbi:hypothetical protein CJ030_MR5G024533 [Morella rubra]|uniref:B-like cyclin n=1 Tax=Morella rubra TaxID=262757 RepID=A0A6A1VPS0_9ROSI|nr:hypothetical protein CJ030_MR5G024533 [Morella rubra]